MSENDRLNDERLDWHQAGDGNDLLAIHSPNGTAMVLVDGDTIQLPSYERARTSDTGTRILMDEIPALIAYLQSCYDHYKANQ